MQANDAIEERPGDGGRCVRVPQQEEVGVLRETVDDREDHRFARHLGQALDEVDGDVRPHLGGNVQRLQEPYRSPRLRLVALAGAAGADPILH
jgi:hypothetical protein